YFLQAKDRKRDRNVTGVQTSALPISFPITDFVGAISTGVMNEGDAVLDLDYEKDFAAAVDMNVVMTGNGEFVEIQGTGEEATFSYQQLQTMLKLAQEGIEALFLKQKAV